MELLLCGGFLGSGKTTLINKLLHGITEQGLTVALIENEACQEGIDAALTGQEGIKVVPLFGGCVCCQLSGSLLETVQKLEAELSPDWVVVELTGLAMMDNIREVFRMYAPKDLTARLHTLAVADMARWDKLVLRMEPVIRRQLAGADTVVINKVDLQPPSPQTLAQIEALSPGAVILSMSAASLSPAEIWTQVSKAFVSGKECTE